MSGSPPSALPALPCRPPPSWPCTCRERSSARPGVGHRCRDQSSPPAGEEGGAGCLHTAAGQPPRPALVHPHVSPPAGGYRLRRTGCSGHLAREKSVPTRPPALPPRRGRPTRRDTRNKSLLCPHGASHGSCAELGDTSPGHNWEGSDGCILRARLWVCPSGADGGRGVLGGSSATSPPPRFRGPHLAERRPLLLTRLVEAVVVLAVRLEDVGGAQLVEGLQRDPRGVPEPHRAILVPDRGGQGGPVSTEP